MRAGEGSVSVPHVMCWLYKQRWPFLKSLEVDRARQHLHAICLIPPLVGCQKSQVLPSMAA